MALLHEAKAGVELQLAEALAVQSKADTAFTLMCTHAAVSHLRSALACQAHADAARGFYAWAQNRTRSVAAEAAHGQRGGEPAGVAAYVEELRQDFFESAQAGGVRVRVKVRVRRLLFESAPAWPQSPTQTLTPLWPGLTP